MIKLPFAGIKGDTASKPVTVQVPCMEMWGETCPVLTEVRPWFKDKSLEDMGRKYWKKKSYLFQGLVVDSKMQEDKTPENPIRRFIMSSQIFNIVKNALMDSEIEELPTDYVRGLDFKIAKTSKGGYADYTTSNWSRRERALSEAENAAIKQYGLHDLKTFLPKKPTDIELRVIKEMFEASVDGDAFDMDRWGAYYKPDGLRSNYTSTPSLPPTQTSARPAPTPVAARPAPAPVDEDAAPWEDDGVAVAESAPESDAGGGASSRASDIIAMIRKRQQTQ
jgi:hypothetical protein